MSYRDSPSAFLSRRARLVTELAEARRAADELARTIERLPRLERELAEIDGLLASGDAQLRRADGTVLTSDCAVRVRRKRTTRAAVAVGVCLLAAATGISATTMAPSERPRVPAPDRSHAAEVPHEATRSEQADERAVIQILDLHAADPDGKRADPKPKIADEMGCSPPYTVDAQGKKNWKLKCL